MKNLAWLALVAVVGVAFLATVVFLMNRPPKLPVEVSEPEATLSATPNQQTHPAPQTHDGFLYGRITGITGRTYEGRLRFGGTEEAFWSEAFNGFKRVNPWAGHVPDKREEQLTRPFMSRFGDIVRIDAGAKELRVTLKSGTVVVLDRMAADDLADGVRIWDVEQGVFDFHEVAIQSIEFLPTPPLEAAPYRLHGTVRTTQGEFSGFIQWSREQCLGTDTLGGLPFGTIRSIAKEPDGAVRVVQLDGTEVAASAPSRGLFVHDPRYGRVLVSWAAFERIDFTAAGSGPGYEEFQPGRPLTGSVTTHDGHTLTGRLVFDLDESETTDTLDAPSGGVDYTIRFGLIASIEPTGGVTLVSGERLRLEAEGDLAARNGGLLIFVAGDEGAEYVPWDEVRRVTFDQPEPTPDA